MTEIFEKNKDFLIAEEVAHQAAEEIAKLREEITKLRAENNRLRIEVCAKQK